ncbi:hypothetical protein ANO14919_000810 [Xylariales sp. No.14919]|nr:hypothetical protein ANO14919_000810 [Xylariales sp. No.14919]
MSTDLPERRRHSTIHFSEPLSPIMDDESGEELGLSSEGPLQQGASSR